MSKLNFISGVTGVVVPVDGEEACVAATVPPTGIDVRVSAYYTISYAYAYALLPLSSVQRELLYDIPHQLKSMLS